MFSKLKQEEEEKNKEEYRKLLCELNQFKEMHKKVVADSEEKTGIINFTHNEIEQLRRKMEAMKDQF